MSISVGNLARPLQACRLDLDGQGLEDKNGSTERFDTVQSGNKTLSHHVRLLSLGP